MHSRRDPKISSKGFRRRSNCRVIVLGLSYSKTGWVQAKKPFESSTTARA